MGWEKYTNWELAARVPWIVSAPWKQQTHGKKTNALTENVDIYATLASLAGLPKPDVACKGCVEGDDASPLFDNPGHEWKRAAFSQYARCSEQEDGYYQRCSGNILKSSAFQAMGYSARTQQWRYTEWFQFDYNTSTTNFNKTIARELYDHTDDAGDDFNKYDQINRADDPSLKDVVAEHAKIVRAGWKQSRPPT